MNWMEQAGFDDPETESENRLASLLKDRAELKLEISDYETRLHTIDSFQYPEVYSEILRLIDQCKFFLEEIENDIRNLSMGQSIVDIYINSGESDISYRSGLN